MQWTLLFLLNSGCLVVCKHGSRSWVCGEFTVPEHVEFKPRLEPDLSTSTCHSFLGPVYLYIAIITVTLIRRTIILNRFIKRIITIVGSAPSAYCVFDYFKINLTNSSGGTMAFKLIALIKICVYITQIFVVCCCSTRWALFKNIIRDNVDGHSKQ